MINWININDEYPDYCTEVLISYKYNSENFGISKASLQYNNKTKKDYWLTDFLPLKGENYDEECEVTHWFPYQDELNYPKEYEMERNN